MVVFVVGDKAFSSRDSAELYEEILKLHDSYSGGRGSGPWGYSC